jgi:2'-5' RNA ligase
MRVFVALELPPEFTASLWDNLAVLREKYLRFRWTRQENLHITLAFLGELDAPGVSFLREAAETAFKNTPIIPVRAEKIITLPQGRPGRTLAAGIEDGGEIAAWAAHFERTLRAVGEKENYPFRQAEKRAFTPHITLARGGAVKIFPEERNLPFPIQGAINRVTVFNSELRGKGPLYTSLWSHPLGP